MLSSCDSQAPTPQLNTDAIAINLPPAHNSTGLTEEEREKILNSIPEPVSAGKGGETKPLLSKRNKNSQSCCAATCCTCCAEKLTKTRVGSSVFSFFSGGGGAAALALNHYGLGYDEPIFWVIATLSAVLNGGVGYLIGMGVEYCCGCNDDSTKANEPTKPSELPESMVQEPVVARAPSFSADSAGGYAIQRRNSAGDMSKYSHGDGEDDSSQLRRSLSESSLASKSSLGNKSSH